MQHSLFPMCGYLSPISFEFVLFVCDGAVSFLCSATYCRFLSTAVASAVCLGAWEHSVSELRSVVAVLCLC